MDLEQQLGTRSSWQQAIDSRLVRQLMRPLTQPGVIGSYVARSIVNRTSGMTAGLPLLDQLAQRWQTEEQAQTRRLPIVYARPAAAAPPAEVAALRVVAPESLPAQRPLVQAQRRAEPMIQRAIEPDSAPNLVQQVTGMVSEQVPAVAFAQREAVVVSDDSGMGAGVPSDEKASPVAVYHPSSGAASPLDTRPAGDLAPVAPQVGEPIYHVAHKLAQPSKIVTMYAQRQLSGSSEPAARPVGQSELAGERPVVRGVALDTPAGDATPVLARSPAQAVAGAMASTWPLAVATQMHGSLEPAEQAAPLTERPDVAAPPSAAIPVPQNELAGERLVVRGVALDTPAGDAAPALAPSPTQAVAVAMASTWPLAVATPAPGSLEPAERPDVAAPPSAAIPVPLDTPADDAAPALARSHMQPATGVAVGAWPSTMIVQRSPDRQHGAPANLPELVAQQQFVERARQVPAEGHSTGLLRNKGDVPLVLARRVEDHSAQAYERSPGAGAVAQSPADRPVVAEPAQEGWPNLAVVPLPVPLGHVSRAPSGDVWERTSGPSAAQRVTRLDDHTVSTVQRQASQNNRSEAAGAGAGQAPVSAAGGFPATGRSDQEELVEQVMRKLLRRLSVERERRGGG